MRFQLQRLSPAWDCWRPLQERSRLALQQPGLVGDRKEVQLWAALVLLRPVGPLQVLPGPGAQG